MSEHKPESIERPVTPVKAPEHVKAIDTRETYLEAAAREWEQVSLVF